MSAPDNAITLREDVKFNPIEGDESLLETSVKCVCGFKGNAGDLLCTQEETTMWCPQCKTSAWQWA